MKNLPILNQNQALQKLDRGRVLEALETAFAGLTNGRSVQPTQTVTVFPENRGDCIFYPGALLDLGLVGVKVSPYLADLAEAGEYPVTAYTLLLSSKNGQPLLLCDSYALTNVRTAATTVLAMKYLMPKQAKVLTVVGSGKVGREHLRFAIDSADWDEIRVYSPKASRDAERQLEIHKEVGNLHSILAHTAREAVEGADVVMLCTSSGTPVVEESWIKPGAFVSSISTNSPGAHEVNPESLRRFDVYCDYRATAPVTAGEMKIAIEDGIWSATSIVADLPELVTGAKVLDSERPRFFRSTGLGIEDLAIAALLVE